MFSRAGSVLRSAWLMLGAALLVFLVAEIALSSFYRFKDHRGRSAGGGDERAGADCYPDSAWVREMFHELGEEDVAWRSYVYWRREPFAGAHIHVDAGGIRRTSNTVPAGEGAAPEILVLGGSTVWGTGARDAFTIPSCLSRELAARGIRCRVVNFGETGYVSTQELVALELELRRGHVPDLVVCYDGVNDTFAAWQSGVAGIPQNESHRAAEFNLASPQRLRQRTMGVVRDTAESLAVLRAARAVLRRAHAPAPTRSASRDEGALAAGVVRVYLANVAIVRALAERYGFDCVFYWQPSLFDKPSRTAYEQSQLAHAASMEPFFRSVSAVAADSLAARGVRNLSGLFAREAAPVFIDWCHPGEAGNAVIARAMADDVSAALRDRTR